MKKRAKSRKKTYEKPIKLAEGVEFDDLINVALKPPVKRRRLRVRRND